MNKLFQWLAILSIPFIVCFYWPLHDMRIMKLACLQYYVFALYCLSVTLRPTRSVVNYWLAALLGIAMLITFTHGMVGKAFLVFFWLPVMAYYSLVNTIEMSTVQIMKKAIVITCLINCALFITQLFHMNLVFQPDPHLRPAGFMVYPFEFALLCSIAFLFAWDWNKWLCIPIAGCLLASFEYAPVFGLLLVLIQKKWIWIWAIGMIVIGILLVKIYTINNLHWWIYTKFAVREPFFMGVLKDCFPRLIDGHGLSAFESSPFQRGNWYELHCEPLDIIYSMGLIGGAWAYGFITSLFGKWDIYTKSFVIIGIVSCVQSCFHYMDICYLCIILYAMFTIERLNI